MILVVSATDSIDKTWSKKVALPKVLVMLAQVEVFVALAPFV